MLEHTPKRVVVKVDMQSKNSYRFSNGQILVMFPDTNQLDRRYTQPVNGIVVSADDILSGAEVLIEHNSTHPTNLIFEYKDDNPDIKYFSVPELECYVWRDTYMIDNTFLYDKYPDVFSNSELAIKETKISDWQPTKYYAIGERVYEPYKGILHGVKPEQIKNTLLIKTGEFKNKIVHIVRNGEYVIIFQEDGKPKEILVTFHVENPDELTDPILSAKQEIIAVDIGLTERYLNGELYVGLTPDDCKPIKTLEYAN